VGGILNFIYPLCLFLCNPFEWKPFSFIIRSKMEMYVSFKRYKYSVTIDFYCVFSLIFIGNHLLLIEVENEELAGICQEG